MPSLCENAEFQTLIRDVILWGGSKWRVHT